MLPTVTGVLAVSNLHCRSFGFGKSKAMITGQIGPVVRARVSDLASLDPDRPAGPAQRATWENALSFFFGLRSFELYFGHGTFVLQRRLT